MPLTSSASMACQRVAAALAIENQNANARQEEHAREATTRIAAMRAAAWCTEGLCKAQSTAI